MLKLSEEAKAKYAKYVDANGRLIIDETLPEDVKNAFNYFNSKGINIMELNVDDDAIIDLPEEESEDLDEELDSDFDETEEEFSSDDSFEDSNEDVDLDNLNSLF